MDRPHSHGRRTRIRPLHCRNGSRGLCTNARQSRVRDAVTRPRQRRDRSDHAQLVDVDGRDTRVRRRNAGARPLLPRRRPLPGAPTDARRNIIGSSRASCAFRALLGQPRREWSAPSAAHGEYIASLALSVRQRPPDDTSPPASHVARFRTYCCTEASAAGSRNIPSPGGSLTKLGHPLRGSQL